MNTGQMMLTIAALMLLSLTILTINRNFLTTNSTLLTNKQTLSATSIATSIIEEATGKSFDENTLSGSSVTSPSIFSANLGPELGEIYNSQNANEFEILMILMDLMILYLSQVRGIIIFGLLWIM